MAQLGVADPGLVAAHSQLDHARGLASSGDFRAAAEAYSRVEAQLRGVAAAVADPELRVPWAEFLRALQQERDLVAAWQAECAAEAAWEAHGTRTPTRSNSGGGSACGGRGSSAFAVDTQSFEVQELPGRPQHGGRGASGGAAEEDRDVWSPPEGAGPSSFLGVPVGREATRREKVDAYERQRRTSLPAASTAAGRRDFSGVKSKINSGAKRLSAPPPPAPGLDLDLFSSTDQELVQQLQRDVLVAVQHVGWEDIAGLEPAKGVLREHLHSTFLYSELFDKIPALRTLKGVLLFGPPGTGKTLLAKAVACAGASADDATAFINVSASTLASKYRGESEKLVRFLFEIARAHQPCVIFIDEIDALCGSRGSQNEHEASRRMKTELLTQIDGMQSGSGGGRPPRVMVLAATNYPWDIDEALRRRLEKRIYIPLPQLADRVELLTIHLRGMKAAPDVDLQQIAARTEGFSGDDIANLVRSAAECVIRRMWAGRAPETVGAREREATLRCIHDALTATGITAHDFDEALRRSNPSCSAADVERHQSFAQTFGCT